MRCLNKAKQEKNLNIKGSFVSKRSWSKISSFVLALTFCPKQINLKLPPLDFLVQFMAKGIKIHVTFKKQSWVALIQLLKSLFDMIQNTQTAAISNLSFSAESNRRHPKTT